MLRSPHRCCGCEPVGQVGERFTKFKTGGSHRSALTVAVLLLSWPDYIDCCRGIALCRNLLHSNIPSHMFCKKDPL